jgi:FkbM family methyltransferase
MQIQTLLNPLRYARSWFRNLTVGADGPSIRSYLEQLAVRKPDAFFVQIGAHDGKTDDHVRSFILDSRWRGIFVEPVPHIFSRLTKNYEAVSDRFVFENVAIADQNETRIFYTVAGGGSDHLPSWYDQLGSFRKEVVLSHKPFIPDICNRLVELRVPCLTFQSLVDRNGVSNIDLVLIDTEGYDLKILATIDFNRFKPDLVIYERKHLSREEEAISIRLLLKEGYSICSSGSNNIAAKWH